MKRNQRAMQLVPLEVCQFCGMANAEHRHHIVPRSITQCDDADNLACLCPRCHRDVHAKSVDLWSCLTPEQRKKAAELMGTESRAYDFLNPSKNWKRAA